MQVQITKLVKPGQTPDLTRNGVATGYVVVPEFPSYLSVSIVMAVMIGTVVLMQSRRKIISIIIYSVKPMITTMAVKFPRYLFYFLYVEM